jgi:hypothetical protein
MQSATTEEQRWPQNNHNKLNNKPCHPDIVEDVASCSNSRKDVLRKIEGTSLKVLLSPRAKAIISTAREIRESQPQQQMIITSRFILFLDLLRKTLKRLTRQDRLLDVEVAKYNKTINSLEVASATALVVYRSLESGFRSNKLHSLSSSHEEPCPQPLFQKKKMIL